MQPDATVSAAPTLHHLHSFRVITACLLAGCLGDVVTTAVAAAHDSRYEQNPLGATLLSHVQWSGTAVLTLVLVWMLYRAGSLVVVKRERAGRLLTAFMACVVFSRWLVAVTAVLSLKGA